MQFLRFMRANGSFLSAGFLFSFSSSYGQTFFIALFAAQFMDAFALTDGEWGGLYAIATTASAAAMIWGGALTDRFRSRGLAVFVMLAFILTCIGMSLATHWIALMALVFALRFLGQGMMSHLAVVSMARWFVRDRGKALAIASMGFSAGTAFLPVIFAALLVSYDWRFVWLIAAGMLAVTLPVIRWLLEQERTPQSQAKEDVAAGMDNRHWTRTEALRHPLIWCLLPLLLGSPTWGTALWFQQVHITEVKEWSLVSFTALFALTSAVAVATSILSGYLIDRFGAVRFLPFFVLPFIVTFLTFGLTDSLTVAALGFVAIGVGQGLNATLISAAVAELYGTRHIGAIKAMVGAALVFGSAIGPAISGFFIDRGTDFPDQMLWIAIYFALAGLLAGIVVARVRPRLAVAT